MQFHRFYNRLKKTIDAESRYVFFANEMAPASAEPGPDRKSEIKKKGYNDFKEYVKEKFNSAVSNYLNEETFNNVINFLNEIKPDETETSYEDFMSYINENDNATDAKSLAKNVFDSIMQFIKDTELDATETSFEEFQKFIDETSENVDEDRFFEDLKETIMSLGNMTLEDVQKANDALLKKFGDLIGEKLKAEFKENIFPVDPNGIFANLIQFFGLMTREEFDALQKQASAVQLSKKDSNIFSEPAKAESVSRTDSDPSSKETPKPTKKSKAVPASTSKPQPSDTPPTKPPPAVPPPPPDSTPPEIKDADVEQSSKMLPADPLIIEYFKAKSEYQEILEERQSIHNHFDGAKGLNAVGLRSQYLRAAGAALKTQNSPVKRIHSVNNSFQGKYGVRVAEFGMALAKTKIPRNQEGFFKAKEETSIGVQEEILKYGGNLSQSFAEAQARGEQMDRDYRAKAAKQRGTFASFVSGRAGSNSSNLEDLMKIYGHHRRGAFGRKGAYEHTRDRLIKSTMRFGGRTWGRPRASFSDAAYVGHLGRFGAIEDLHSIHGYGSKYHLVGARSLKRVRFNPETGGYDNVTDDYNRFVFGSRAGSRVGFGGASFLPQRPIDGYSTTDPYRNAYTGMRRGGGAYDRVVNSYYASRGGTQYLKDQAKLRAGYTKEYMGDYESNVKKFYALGDSLVDGVPVKEHPRYNFYWKEWDRMLRKYNGNFPDQFQYLLGLQKQIDAYERAVKVNGLLDKNRESFKGKVLQSEIFRIPRGIAADDHTLNVSVTRHNPDGTQTTFRTRPASVYQIAGSADMDNMLDMGVFIERQYFSIAERGGNGKFPLKGVKLDFAKEGRYSVTVSAEGYSNTKEVLVGRGAESSRAAQIEKMKRSVIGTVDLTATGPLASIDVWRANEDKQTLQISANPFNEPHFLDNGVIVEKIPSYDGKKSIYRFSFTKPGRHSIRGFKLRGGAIGMSQDIDVNPAPPKSFIPFAAPNAPDRDNTTPPRPPKIGEVNKNGYNTINLKDDFKGVNRASRSTPDTTTSATKDSETTPIEPEDESFKEQFQNWTLDKDLTLDYNFAKNKNVVTIFKKTGEKRFNFKFTFEFNKEGEPIIKKAENAEGREFDLSELDGTKPVIDQIKSIIKQGADKVDADWTEVETKKIKNVIGMLKKRLPHLLFRQSDGSNFSYIVEIQDAKKETKSNILYIKLTSREKDEYEIGEYEYGRNTKERYAGTFSKTNMEGLYKILESTRTVEDVDSRVEKKILFRMLHAYYPDKYKLSRPLKAEITDVWQLPKDHPYRKLYAEIINKELGDQIAETKRLLAEEGPTNFSTQYSFMRLNVMYRDLLVDSNRFATGNSASTTIPVRDYLKTLTMQYVEHTPKMEQGKYVEYKTKNYTIKPNPEDQQYYLFDENGKQLLVYPQVDPYKTQKRGRPEVTMPEIKVDKAPPKTLDPDAPVQPLDSVEDFVDEVERGGAPAPAAAERLEKNERERAFRKSIEKIARKLEGKETENAVLGTLDLHYSREGNLSASIDFKSKKPIVEDQKTGKKTNREGKINIFRSDSVHIEYKPKSKRVLGNISIRNPELALSIIDSQCNDLLDPHELELRFLYNLQGETYPQNRIKDLEERIKIVKGDLKLLPKENSLKLFLKEYEQRLAAEKERAKNTAFPDLDKRPNASDDTDDILREIEEEESKFPAANAESDIEKRQRQKVKELISRKIGADFDIKSVSKTTQKNEYSFYMTHVKTNASVRLNLTVLENNKIDPPIEDVIERINSVINEDTEKNLPTPGFPDLDKKPNGDTGGSQDLDDLLDQ